MSNAEIFYFNNSFTIWSIDSFHAIRHTTIIINLLITFVQLTLFHTSNLIGREIRLSMRISDRFVALYACIRLDGALFIWKSLQVIYSVVNTIYVLRCAFSSTSIELSYHSSYIDGSVRKSQSGALAFKILIWKIDDIKRIYSLDPPTQYLLLVYVSTTSIAIELIKANGKMPKQLISNLKLETKYDYTLYNLHISVASTLQIATQNASDCGIDFDRTSSNGNDILTFEHQIEIDLFMFIVYNIYNEEHEIGLFVRTWA